MITEMQISDFQLIGEKFRLPGKIERFEVISGGNINKTYRVIYLMDGGWEKSYLFQKINTYVFKRPEDVMENIDGVTTHIYKKRGGVNALHFHHTADGKNYYVEPENECFWRVRNYFDSVTFDVCDDTEVLYLAGVAFGMFQKDLRDFDASRLHDTIKDFHNTEKRLDTLFSHAEEDPCGRVCEVGEELAYIASVREKAGTLSRMLAAGELPLRVTHNDTKINNVLFHPETHRPLTVIDLDTVMPGLVASDYGDAVRFSSNTSAEDEPDVSKVALDLNKFTAFSEGFIPCLKDSLTQIELDTLALGVFCITVELASRFLDDYITGDKYFKVVYDGHNLVRTRAQLTLAKDIDRKLPQMEQIITELCRTH